MPGRARIGVKKRVLILVSNEAFTIAESMASPKRHCICRSSSPASSDVRPNTTIFIASLYGCLCKNTSHHDGDTREVCGEEIHRRREPNACGAVPGAAR